MSGADQDGLAIYSLETIKMYALDRLAICRQETIEIISKMYFSLWEPPEVSERMWSVTLDGSMSEEYQTVGGHSGQPSK
jgi:hypothetical protein